MVFQRAQNANTAHVFLNVSHSSFVRRKGKLALLQIISLSAHKSKHFPGEYNRKTRLSIMCIVRSIVDLIERVKS